jgi:hypothetical protein
MQGVASTAAASALNLDLLSPGRSGLQTSPQLQHYRLCNQLPEGLHVYAPHGTAWRTMGCACAQCGTLGMKSRSRLHSRECHKACAVKVSCNTTACTRDLGLKLCVHCLYQSSIVTARKRLQICFCMGVCEKKPQGLCQQFGNSNGEPLSTVSASCQ